MAKYNLTEKKQKTPLYRSLLKMETIDEIYQQIMAKFIVEKKYRDCNYSAKKMAEELNTNVRYISAIVNLRYQDNYSQMVNEFRIKEAMYTNSLTGAATLSTSERNPVLTLSPHSRFRPACSISVWQWPAPSSTRHTSRKSIQRACTMTSRRCFGCRCLG